MKRLFFFIVALATFVWGKAQTEEAASSEPQIDSLYVSLLTCAPGADAYKLFGHTAIRVKGEGEKSFDFAFNYGMFNYQKKNFVYRFVRGETDYELGAEPTDFSFLAIRRRGLRLMSRC